jgi:hypothetical protein
LPDCRQVIFVSPKQMYGKREGEREREREREIFIEREIYRER